MEELPPYVENGHVATYTQGQLTFVNLSSVRVAAEGFDQGPWIAAERFGGENLPIMWQFGLPICFTSTSAHYAMQHVKHKMAQTARN